MGENAVLCFVPHRKGTPLAMSSPSPVPRHTCLLAIAIASCAIAASAASCASHESAREVDSTLESIDLTPLKGIVDPQTAQDMPKAVNAIKKTLLTTDHSQENIEKAINDSGMSSAEFKESLHVMLIDYPKAFHSFLRRLKDEMGVSDDVIDVLLMLAA